MKRLKNIFWIWFLPPVSLKITDFRNLKIISVSGLLREHQLTLRLLQEHAFLKGRAFVIPEDVKHWQKMFETQNGINFEAEAEEIST
jgi:MoxR-like ATPase